ncbi:histone H4 transcription factor [Harmonia axyridis]|uniref:histone H4 transcription factor n=1 Tax=Harmonia axyridis TaxID=115357 RepID=UPI001E2751BD|nr:histone H4 transcription factor [Harmonia axyridis]
MKTRSRLAVFENINNNENTTNNEDDDANDSYDEEVKDTSKIKKKINKISEQPITFPCRFRECGQEFTDYFKFDNHLISHINQEDFTGKIIHAFCQYGDCDLRFVSYLHAIQHMSIHGHHDKLCYLGEIAVKKNSLPECKLENIFTCPESEVVYHCEWDSCNMVIDTICNFLCHIKMHSMGNSVKDKKKIDCEWKGCKQQFKMQYQLSKHMPVHTKTKYLACITCGNSFSSMARFSDHRSKQIPIEKQNYKCSQCFKVFATESLIRDHVRAHINQYKCPMCDMTCPKPSNLINHIRFRHINERLYQCNLCEHSALSKQNLEQHLISHCTEMLMVCDECDFACRSIHTLDRHIQREHLKDRQMFECHICKKRYKRGNILSQHLVAVHSVQYPSGHSRFRYKKEADGIARLQTIRYETVNVIKEIIESKKKEEIPDKKVLKCTIKKKKDGDNMSVAVNIEECSSSDEEERPTKKRKKSSNNVLLTVLDLDDKGNVVSEVTETQEVIAPEPDMMEI